MSKTLDETAPWKFLERCFAWVRQFIHTLVFGLLLLIFVLIALPQLVGQGANPLLLLAVFWSATWMGYLSPERRKRGRHRAPRRDGTDGRGVGVSPR